MKPFSFLLFKIFVLNCIVLVACSLWLFSLVHTTALLGQKSKAIEYYTQNYTYCVGNCSVLQQYNKIQVDVPTYNYFYFFFAVVCWLLSAETMSYLYREHKKIKLWEKAQE